MRRGFTLLEVMIALAFVALALVAVIRAEGQGLRLAGEARFTSRAVFLANYILADAQSRGDLNPGTKDGSFGGQGLDDMKIEGLSDDLRWMREVTPVQFFPGLYKVQVWIYLSKTPPRQGLTLQGFAYRASQGS